MSGFSDLINRITGRALKRHWIKASSSVWRTPSFLLAPGENRHVFRFVRLVNLPPRQRVAGNPRIVCEALRQGQISQWDMALDTFPGGTEDHNEKGNDLTINHCCPHLLADTENQRSHLDIDLDQTIAGPERVAELLV
jgi:hypothetical protein